MPLEEIDQTTSTGGTTMSEIDTIADMSWKNTEFQDMAIKSYLQGGLDNKAVRTRTDRSFGGRFGAAWEQQNVVGNLEDIRQLSVARRTKDYSTPLTTILEGVPENYKSTIQREYENYGSAGALVYKEQLLIDLENNTVFDSLPFHKQLGYGGLAILLDPVSWVTGGGTGTAAIKGVQTLKALPLIKGKPIAEAAATIGTWGVASGIEGALYDAPRALEGDLTYTSSDYLTTIALSAGFGTALSGAILGGSKYLDYREIKKYQQQYVSDLEKVIKDQRAATESVEQPLLEQNKWGFGLTQSGDNLLMDTDNWMKDYGSVFEYNKQQAPIKLGDQVKLSESAQTALDGKYVPTLTDIMKIDTVETPVVNGVLNVAKNKMPEKSGILNLLKRTVGLNKKVNNLQDNDVSKRSKSEVQKLNATVSKLAVAFPDGVVPREFAAVINELRFGQQEWVTTNAIKDIVSGAANDPVKPLTQYVSKLKGLDIWDGADTVPIDFTTLKQYLPDILDDTLDANLKLERLPVKERELFEDIRELNRQAENSPDTLFKDLVNEVNGMLARRLEMKELGVLGSALKATNKTQWYKPNAKLTGTEIRQQLKSEGIEPFTPEYREALDAARLRANERIEQAGDIPDKQAQKIEKEEYKFVEDAVSGGMLTKHNPIWKQRKTELEQQDVTVSKEVREVGNIQPREIRPEQLIEDSSAVVNRMDSGDTPANMVSDIDNKTGATDIDFRLDTPREKYTKALEEDELLNDDLLPLQLNEPRKLDAFSEPTPENISRLNKQLTDRVLKKVSEKIEQVQKVLDTNNKVTTRAMKAVAAKYRGDAAGIVSRAVESNDMSNLVLIMRTSKDVADEYKVKVEELTEQVKQVPTTKSDKSTKGVSTSRTEPVDNFKSTVLTDEILTKLQYPTISKMSPNELKAVNSQVEFSYTQLVNKKLTEISRTLGKYETSGEKGQLDKLIAVKNFGDALGRKLSFLTKDIATTLQASDLTSMNFIGHKVTELGRGYGGQGKRGATGGLIKHKVLTDLQMSFMPDYVKAMHDYSVSIGDNSFKTLNAQQMLGVHNPTVAKFNREFMLIQEFKRTGKQIPESMSSKLKPIIDFANKWDIMMANAHKYLTDANIAGFSKDRVIKNYVPRVHQYAKYKTAIKVHGLDRVQYLLQQAIRNGDRTRTLTDELIKKRADDFIKWVLKQDGTTPVEDMFMPAIDSRAMSRMDMDMTTSIDDLSMLDLVNTEVMELGMKYSNRVAGWVGLSDSTKGLLNSNAAIDAFKHHIGAEASVKGSNTKKATQHFDDVINMMFGRPTRNGLPEELRMLKDMTALTRMGGLGSAQLIESGQVLTKSMINMFSDPKVAKRLFAVAKSNPDDVGLLKEIQAITRLTDDMEHMQRQSVNLEQTEKTGTQPWRRLSVGLADKMTFGSYKAPASRLLGKVTGFNAVRRYQSRVAQTGFVLNAIGHFSRGKSALTPERLADLGLATPDGKNDALADTIKKYVEFDEDNLPTKLNFDKWPKDVADEFTYAMLRDEAQNVQKSLVGELPAWYNKPLMALAFQFRQFPIVAQNKQLGRALALADKEAVIATLMNAATAGIVRLSKLALVAGGISSVTDNDFRYNVSENTALDVSKYVAQFGILPDATDFVLKAYKSYDDDGFSQDFGDTMLSFAPIWGLMKDYKDSVSPSSTQRERIDATFGITPLGNIFFADMVRAKAQEEFEE